MDKETVQKCENGKDWNKVGIISKMITDRQHYIVRVGDGVNFLASRENFWGFNKKEPGMKTRIKKLKNGDVLYFITSKKFGGNVIGIGEYTGTFYDREDEPLLLIHTKSNKEQGWDGDDEWKLQVHYRNLYLPKMIKINCIVSCASSLLSYRTFKDRINEDLPLHWNMFKKYGTCFKN